MPSEWYFDENGKVFGPFSTASMKQMARKRRINPMTPVRNGPNGPWLSWHQVQSDDEKKPERPTTDDSHAGEICGLGRGSFYFVASLPIFGLLIAGLAVLLINRSIRERNAREAEAALEIAVNRAEVWLKSGKMSVAAEVEDEIRLALQSSYLKERTNGENALARVKTKQAGISADQIFAKAQTAIKDERLQDAHRLITEYLKAPHATQAAAAKALAEEILEATLSERAIAALCSLSDDDFARFVTQKTVNDDSKVRDPTLQKRRIALFEAVSQQANQQRVEIRQKREAKLAAERKATEDQQRLAKLDSERKQQDIREAERQENERTAPIPLTAERQRRSENAEKYVLHHLQSTNSNSVVGMALLMRFNLLCDKGTFAKEDVANAVGSDRDRLAFAAQILVDVNDWIPPKSKRKLTLKESWRAVMDKLGVE